MPREGVNYELVGAPTKRYLMDAWMHAFETRPLFLLFTYRAIGAAEADGGRVKVRVVGLGYESSQPHRILMRGYTVDTGQRVDALVDTKLSTGTLRFS